MGTDYRPAFRDYVRLRTGGELTKPQQIFGIQALALRVVRVRAESGWGNVGRRNVLYSSRFPTSFIVLV